MYSNDDYLRQAKSARSASNPWIMDLDPVLRSQQSFSPEPSLSSYISIIRGSDDRLMTIRLIWRISFLCHLGLLYCPHYFGGKHGHEPPMASGKSLISGPFLPDLFR
jgi:hypothetical protein